jgi:Ca2+-binding EF-hand superfamily protein
VSPISSEELRESFDFFDKDGDGKLSQNEFAGLLETLGEAEKGQDLSRRFKAMDSDGNGLVDFSEFARWFAAR